MTPPRSPRVNRCARATVVLLLLAALIAGGCSVESDEEVEADAPPPEVPVRQVEREPISVERAYTGRTFGARQVNIRARVDGMLHRRGYAEGSIVEEGAELFRIDPSPYEVIVQIAEAELERAEAEQRQAEREWERVSDLYDDDAASARERDEVQSELELAGAGVALAEAQLAEAQIDLDFTVVEAPLRGVAGMEEAPEGSLIDSGDLLTTVTQLDPIHVRFSIPEGHMSAYGSQIRSGTGVTVTLRNRNGGEYNEHGRIDYTEASVDPDTGTVDARAIFPNPSEELMPGQFVRLAVSGLHAGWGFRIPHAALLEDENGSALYLLDDDDRLVKRGVTVGLDLGDDFLVTDGLEDGDRVVVGGIGELDEGDQVHPQPSPRDDDEEPGGVLGVLPPADDELSEEDLEEEEDAGDEDEADPDGNGNRNGNGTDEAPESDVAADARDAAEEAAAAIEDDDNGDGDE